MSYGKTPLALALAAVMYGGAAQAQTSGAKTEPARPGGAAELPPVVVTGNPLGSELFDLATPVTVLGGEKLRQRLQPTLGETLANEPGMSSTYYGPNASRPVIRGLDGERLRILQNGVINLDASGTSVDHNVSLDPLLVDRIEVIRGPVAVFYGTSAIGGVVNVIDDRIATERVPQGISGAFDARHGSNNDEKAGAGRIEIGLPNGLNLHFDAFSRETGDLRIPGANVSTRQQAIDPARPVTFGTLPNSASRSDGGALGASYTWGKGYLGASFSGYGSNYGTVAEPDVKIDMRQQRVDLAGEWRDLAPLVKAIKVKYGYSDYKHTELEGDVPGTTFKNRGYDTRVELVHDRIGPFQGAIGLQITNFDFSALGDEAFLPPTRNRALGVFLFEEVPLGRVTLQFGGRLDRSAVEADPSAILATADSRNFNTRSGSAGIIYNFTSDYAVAFTMAYTERAPNYQELFSNGRHAATGAFESGDRNLAIEKSTAFDLALRKKRGRLTGSVGVFHSRFDNFIALAPTGADDGDPVEPFPIFAYRAIPAEFRGAEASGTFWLRDQPVDRLGLELRADTVRAENSDTGEPLPRISPTRFGGGIVYQKEKLGARLDVLRVQSQGRVSANEIPTDGYTMVNASGSYRIKMQGLNVEAFLRGVNLLNQEARNHVSFIKDIAPYGKRGFQIGMRASF